MSGAPAREPGLHPAAPFRSLVLLLAIVLVALLLRFAGLSYGLPDHMSHSDTPKQLDRVAWFLRGDLVPGDTYPTLHMYVVALLLKGWFWLDPHAVDVGPTWTQVVVVARLLNASLGAGLVLLVYRLASHLGGWRAGLLAAALLAVEPTHVLHAHYEMGDMLQAFCALASVAGAVAVLASGRTGTYVATGVLAGLAASAKFYGVVAAGALAVAATGRLRRDGVGRPLAQLALAGLVTVATFALTTPKLLLTPVDFFEGLRASGELFTVPPPPLPLRPLVAGRLLAGLALEWPGPLLAGLGLVGLALLARTGVPGAVVLATPLATLLVYVLFRPTYLDDRNLVILIPFLVIGAAFVLDRLAQAGGGRARLAGGLAIAALLVGTVASLHTTYLFRHDDTRQFAERWERARLPPDAVVHRDILRPTAAGLAALNADYVVLDSQNYRRFVDWHSPTRTTEVPALLADLEARGRLVKRFQLWPRAFTDATLLYYDLRPAPPYAFPAPDDVVRPADSLAFVDDHSLPEHLGLRATRAVRRLTVVSPRPLDRLTVAVSGEGRVRVRHGFRTRAASLGPGEVALLRFEPWRVFPWFTSTYHLEVDARRASVHARVLTDGCQEARPLLARGRFTDAAAGLEGCQPARWTEPARLLDLAWARAEAGQTAEARAALTRLEAAAPGLLDQLARLADQEADDAWGERYRMALGYPRGFWAAHVFTAQAETAEIRPGTVEAVAGAGGGRVVRMRAPGDPEGYLKLWLPQEFLYGAYRVAFRVRGTPAGGGPLATFSVVRHFDDRVYDVAVTRSWAGSRDGSRFELVTLPVVTDVEPLRLEARMLFHGRGTVELDQVTVVPDVRVALAARIHALRGRGLLGGPGGA